jgi:hypothetical protein
LPENTPFQSWHTVGEYALKSIVSFALVICMCYNRDGKWDIFHKQLVNIKRQLQQEPTDGVKQSAALLCWVFIIGCKLNHLHSHLIEWRKNTRAK